MNSVTALILTSAGIAAIVSGAITLLGQFFERRSRRRELLLTEALRLARARSQMTLEVAEKTKSKAVIHDDIALAERYYQWLAELLKYGALPPGAPRVTERLDSPDEVR